MGRETTRRCQIPPGLDHDWKGFSEFDSAAFHDQAQPEGRSYHHELSLKMFVEPGQGP